MTDQRVAVGPHYWLYPADHTPPTGVKLALLTRGGVQVTGQWSGDGSFTAWQYLFRRDKTKESEESL